MRSHPSVLCSGLNQPNSHTFSHKREDLDSLCSRSLCICWTLSRSSLCEEPRTECNISSRTADGHGAFLDNIISYWLCTSLLLLMHRAVLYLMENRWENRTGVRMCMEYFGMGMRKPGENHKWNRNEGGEKAGLQRVDWRSDEVNSWVGVRRVAQTAVSLCAWLLLQMETFEARRKWHFAHKCCASDWGIY